MTHPTNCRVCGLQVTRFIKSKNDWWEWCSNKCMGSDPIILEKKRQTCLAKFGADHPMHSAPYQQKLKDSMLAKYGVDNPSKNAAVKQKMKNTFIQNYGVDNPSKNLDIKIKIRDIAIERFADPAKKESVLVKRRATCNAVFNCDTNKHVHISTESLHLMKDLEWLTHQHIVLKKSCQQIADELMVSATPILEFLASNNVKIIRHSTSRIHAEIVDYIKSLYSGSIDVNTRAIITPKEIDIYLPDLKLGFEINGVYWHSEEKGKDKFYHLAKTRMCEAQSIHLIHIYDIEWKDPVKQRIIKSKIKHLLKLSTCIYARKCILKELTSVEATKFIDENHLQGACASKIKIGMYYDKELVAVSTFGSARFNKSYEWELIRYCTKQSTTVVGGLSKMLAFVRKKYSITSLISYADRRWSELSNSNLYKTTGFNLIHQADPNYKYFKINNVIVLHSRNQWQKHMLKNKLETFDNQLSEYENMSLNGYYRIWDCGNLVYGVSTDE